MAGRPRDAVILSDEERNTLLRWSRSRTCAQARAQRARIVLACAGEPTNTAVAQRLGISRDMVGTWRTRFLADRLAGLDDRPRPGRPPEVDDDTVAHVLVRTLTPPPGGKPGWSTRSMAAETGLSQSTVSRIWRLYQIHPSASGSAVARRSYSLPDQAREVVGLYLAPPVCLLAVTAADSMPGHARLAPQVLAVACAFAALRGPQSPSRIDDHALNAFLERLGQMVRSGANVHLLASGLPATTTRPHKSVRWHLAPTPQAWTDETRRVLTADSQRSHQLAADRLPLRDALLTWCSTWTPATPPLAKTVAARSQYICGPGADSAVPQERTVRPTQMSPTPATSATAPGAPITTDPVVGLLREALLTGAYQPGDRVRETPLAERFGLSRRAVRAALRTLAEEGMLDLLPNGGTAIPAVTVKDVLDLYALRASLGALLVRRVAMLGPERLGPVSAALAEVRAASRDSEGARIREDDLRFQDALARIADLPQAARTFEHLTARLRTFVNVLHMDYGPARHLIAAEDAAVHGALLNADGNEAARLWRVKIERCVRYMVAQLPQGYDPRLWATIAGKPHPRQGDPQAAAH